MKITDQFTIVRLPVREADSAVSAPSAEFLVDKVVLHSGMYEKLFGTSLATQSEGRPWKRGVVTIRMKQGEVTRCIRRVYAGHGSLKISQQAIGLDIGSCAELGVKGGDTYTLELSGGSSTFRRFVDRVWHYWNHPTDAVRASFKLGVVGLVYAVKDDIPAALRALSALFGG
jgi:hypothetical protein